MLQNTSSGYTVGKYVHHTRRSNEYDIMYYGRNC